MSAYEKFNITIDELLTELGYMFDEMHRVGMSEENGTLMEVISLLLQAYTGEDLCKAYAESYEVWKDCYKREHTFLLKDFSQVLGLDLEPIKKLQAPVKVYFERKGNDCPITEEDIECILDFFVALSRRACEYVVEKRQSTPDFLPEFPLEECITNFKL